MHMPLLLLHRRLVLLLLLTLACLAPCSAYARKWTYAEGGETFYGEFKELMGTERVVVFEEWRGPRQTRRVMPLDALSLDDIAYIAGVVRGEIIYEEYGRVWTARNGQKLRATFVERHEDGRVLLRCEDGTTVPIRFDNLVEADQALVMQSSLAIGSAVLENPPGHSDPPGATPLTLPALPLDGAAPPRSPDPHADSAAPAPEPPWYTLPSSQRPAARAALMARHRGLVRSLYALALGLCVAGWAWLVSVASQAGREWFWILLIGGPLTLGLTCVIFALGRFQRAKLPFLLWLVGILTWLLTLVGLPYWLA